VARDAVPRRPRLTLIVAALLLVQAALLVYFGSFPTHFHQDEFETAYASYQLPALGEVDWLGPYPAADAWVAKFPIPFFALQAPFLKLLGPSVETVRLSTWPYQALTVAYLFVTGRRLLGSATLAATAVLVYLLFAPSVYLASLGVHFHSSTLAVTAALYHCQALLDGGGRRHAVALGLFAAAGYLTYTASYLVLPLVAALVGCDALLRRRRPPLGRLALAGGAFAALLGPFVYGAATRHNYLLQRSGQTVARPSLEHAWRSLVALRQDGLVGVAGYDFGRLAPLDDLTLSLLLVGAGAGAWSAARQRRAAHLLPLALCLAALAAGMLLTTPVGALHRTVVAFPFLGLLAAQALALLRRWPAAVAAVVLLFAVVQLPRAARMVEPDQSHPSPTIAAYLLDRAPPGERVVVVGLLHYHLARELTIRTGDRYEVVATAWPELPSHLGGAVVIHQPDDEKLRRVASLMPGATEVAFFEGGDANDHGVLVPAP
jgi:hypothetical protein